MSSPFSLTMWTATQPSRLSMSHTHFLVAHSCCRASRRCCSLARSASVAMAGAGGAGGAGAVGVGAETQRRMSAAARRGGDACVCVGGGTGTEPLANVQGGTRRAGGELCGRGRAAAANGTTAATDRQRRHTHTHVRQRRRVKGGRKARRKRGNAQTLTHTSAVARRRVHGVRRASRPWLSPPCGWQRPSPRPARGFRSATAIGGACMSFSSRGEPHERSHHATQTTKKAAYQAAHRIRTVRDSGIYRWARRPPDQHARHCDQLGTEHSSMVEKNGVTGSAVGDGRCHWQTRCCEPTYRINGGRQGGGALSS